MLDTQDHRRASASRSRAGRSRASGVVLAAIAAGSVFLALPASARADDVSPSGKGVVGGAFLGGEVVVFGEALFGVRSSAAYLLGAGAGAVAGGVGGYFVEQAVSDGRIPVYMLAGGLALVIPALVIGLDQTRYLPTEGARDEKPVTNLPPSDPGKPGGSAVVGAEPSSRTVAPTAPGGGSPTAIPPSGATPAPAPAPTSAPTGGGGGGARAPMRGPLSLINLDNGALRVGVPLPEVRPVFTASQKKALGVENAGSEVRFPVMHVVF